MPFFVSDCQTLCKRVQWTPNTQETITIQFSNSFLFDDVLPLR